MASPASGEDGHGGRGELLGQPHCEGDDRQWRVGLARGREHRRAEHVEIRRIEQGEVAVGRTPSRRLAAIRALPIWCEPCDISASAELAAAASLWRYSTRPKPAAASQDASA